MGNNITLEISEKVTFADNTIFGNSGTYERLNGRAFYEIDPKQAEQDGIVDVQYAPKNKKGLVEFSSDFLIIKPTELRKGNKRLFYDFGNRGNMRALQFFNDAKLPEL